MKVEILKTDAKGGNEVVLGSQEQKMPVNYLHHDLPTFFIKVGQATFKDELLAVRLTKVNGAEVVIGFNANDYDSNLVILSKPPAAPGRRSDDLHLSQLHQCADRRPDLLDLRRQDLPFAGRRTGDPCRRGLLPACMSA